MTAEPLILSSNRVIDGITDCRKRLSRDTTTWIRNDRYNSASRRCCWRSQQSNVSPNIGFEQNAFRARFGEWGSAKYTQEARRGYLRGTLSGLFDTTDYGKAQIAIAVW